MTQRTILLSPKPLLTPRFQADHFNWDISDNFCQPDCEVDDGTGTRRDSDGCRFDRPSDETSCRSARGSVCAHRQACSSICHPVRRQAGRCPRTVTCTISTTELLSELLGMAEHDR